MLPGIFLSDRRRQQIILCIIVDHCLCHNLVITWISGRIAKIFIHKSRHLIHVKIDIRNVRRLHITDPVKTLHDTIQQIFRVYMHMLYHAFPL